MLKCVFVGASNRIADILTITYFRYFDFIYSIFQAVATFHSKEKVFYQLQST